MTRDELINMAEATFAECLQVMKSKNDDYAGVSGDPFTNFKASTLMGIEPERGLMLRVTDKFMRIKNFIDRGELSVKDEPVDDAISDIINYMILLKGLIKDKKEETNEHKTKYTNHTLTTHAEWLRDQSRPK